MTLEEKKDEIVMKIRKDETTLRKSFPELIIVLFAMVFIGMSSILLSAALLVLPVQWPPFILSVILGLIGLSLAVKVSVKLIREIKIAMIEKKIEERDMKVELD
ncbi:hypothetical protein C4561_01385 [candidate division WWE3 bacterium]|uniref:Uncharacterized protein n=1 Tax=candidate division WWE3 bacterium TaxID=2053526 RepID=A0A3A4ZEX9_UNCKA|nr:MAG: hypothetical protein C4561_01385 [candidate division WWE3 bacterium]